MIRKRKTVMELDSYFDDKRTLESDTCQGAQSSIYWLWPFRFL